MRIMKDNIIYKAFAELFYASKKMFCLSYALTFFQGVSRILPIVAIQQLFDHLYLLSETNGKQRIIIYVLAYMGARCVCHIIDFFTNYLYESYNLFAGFGMDNNVNEKIYNTEAIQFEKKDYLDTVTKSYRGTRSIRSFIDSWMMIFFLYVPELLVIIFYLYHANHLLPIILLFIAIPCFFVLKLQEKEYASLEEKISTIQRKQEVYEEQAFDLKSNVESRVLGFVDLLMSKIEKCIEETATLDYEYQIKKNKMTNVKKCIILFGYISIFVVLLYCLFNGLITIGVFSALLTTLDELFELMETIISSLSEGVSEELEKIRNYFKLTAYHKSHEGKKIEITHIENIEFRNVSFYYPDCEKKAIDQVSFKIDEGEHIAIVGKNGSGKSTLLKLLSGLYECSEGQILINGIDIKDIDKNILYQLFSAVFQNFGRYALKLNENIALTEESDCKRIDEIIGFEGLNELAQIDENAILSRRFGKIDLSGGQWQRIAIARCCYRNGEVCILDEPTSAIDPNEEKVLYDLFGEIMNRNTSLLVTHRMGATKLADRIFVMSKGKIVGDGTHNTLISSNSEYQQLWNSQARLFVDNLSD